MLSRALAVALLLALPSVASAQVPVGFGFPQEPHGVRLASIADS
jgi:hypothetical protein